jgi:hypothetical protein
MSIANLKTLIGAAIALGSCVVAAAPASADTGGASAGPNLFSILSCNCQEPAPPHSPALRNEIPRGIQDGLSASPLLYVDALFARYRDTVAAYHPRTPDRARWRA